MYGVREILSQKAKISSKVLSKSSKGVEIRLGCPSENI
jgi:hypothetical protein